MSGRTAPLEGSYVSKILLVLGALCPFIVASTATTLLQPHLLVDLRTSRAALQLADGMANAGYAFGAVLAVALAKRHSPRRLLFAYETLFVGGCVLAAVAHDATVYGMGRCVQGFATGLLLVAALPPLVTAFPAARLPVTVAVVDVGLFGATTVGPIVGAYAGAHDAWRLTFAVLAAIGVLTLATAWLSVGSGEPADPAGALDPPALGLAAAATALPFFGASELAAHPVVSGWVLPGLIIGLAALVTLVVVEYRRRQPLTPVRLLAHTFPVTGLIAAMVAGAVAVASLDIAQTFVVTVQRRVLPGAGLLFWPAVVALAAAAGAFGRMLRTRYLPALILVGAVVLGAGAVTLATFGPRSGSAGIALVAAAIGFGAGATVSPGLFLAGLSCPSSQLGPAFALVELLRSEAAFLVAPVLLHVAMSHGSSPAQLAHGLRVASAVDASLLGAGTVLCVAFWLVGGARLQEPDLVAWVDDGGEAFDSPPVAAALR